jgi:hypothetical protein
MLGTVLLSTANPTVGTLVVCLNLQGLSAVLATASIR